MSTSIAQERQPDEQFVTAPDVPWSGLLAALSDLGHAKHWANDPVVESYIEAGMKRLREHITDDILAAAAPPAWGDAQS